MLIVTKLDRLGRNTMDPRRTVVARTWVKAHCLALGGVHRTSPAGKMTMAVISAAAEFVRDLLRTSRAEHAQEAEALQRLAAGEAVVAVPRALETSRAPLMRVRNSKVT